MQTNEQEPTIDSYADPDGPLDGRFSPEAIVEDNSEYDFLVMQRPRSKQPWRTAYQTGTRLSINPDVCMTCAAEIVQKGWYCPQDVDTLIAHCQGNCNEEELRANIQRTLEDAGFELIYPEADDETKIWEAKSDLSAAELAEGLQTTLTRKISLPGTQRFFMDAGIGQRLQQPMLQAKQKLLENIIACDTAVQIILHMTDRVLDGSRDLGSVTLKKIHYKQPGRDAKAEFLAAVKFLKSWQANDRVMDGEPMEQAIAALEELKLSQEFYKELVGLLKQKQVPAEDTDKLAALISDLDAAMQQLVLDHLPVARRWAVRETKEGEDPEDTFQRIVIGLILAPFNFKPEYGVAFTEYFNHSTALLLPRWKARVENIAHIPEHRRLDMDRFIHAIDNLCSQPDDIVPDRELAAELNWPVDKVREHHAYLRKAEYPENLAAWVDLLGGKEDDTDIERENIKKAIANVLAKLPEREANIIKMRYRIGPASESDAELDAELDSLVTLQAIGEVYGITRERVRQIERQALIYLSKRKIKNDLRQRLGR